MLLSTFRKATVIYNKDMDISNVQSNIQNIASVDPVAFRKSVLTTKAKKAMRWPTYTVNYKTKLDASGHQYVASTMFTLYGSAASRKRAVDATADLAMYAVVSYKGVNSTQIKVLSPQMDPSIVDGSLDQATITARQSTTYYVGYKGEEIADYSYVFKISTNMVRQISINFYRSATTNLVRATSVDLSDRALRR